MREFVDERISISDQEIVEVVYRSLLGRASEATGKRVNLERRKEFDRDSDWLKAMITNTINSKEFLERIRLKLFDGNLFVERSQHGEVEILLKDIIAKSLLSIRTAPIIVDVGASGKAISNSYDLLKHFALRGLLIEANPDQCASIERDFAGLDVAVINSAIAADEREVELWVSSSNTHIASLVAKRFDDWRNRENFSDLEKDKVFKLISRRLPDILKENNIPNSFLLLSIDIEGLDIDVLNDMFMNSSYEPYYMIVEGIHNRIEKSVPAIRDKYDVVSATSSNVLYRRREA